VTLFVEPEPALSVGGMEPGIADAARQLVDVVALLSDPAEQYGAGDQKGVQQVLGATEISAPQPAQHG
jgi:hypothetical protein